MRALMICVMLNGPGDEKHLDTVLQLLDVAGVQHFQMPADEIADILGDYKNTLREYQDLIKQIDRRLGKLEQQFIFRRGSR